MKIERLLLFLVAVPSLYSQPINLCEVLANLSELNGKHIQVRGVWRRGDAGQSLWPLSPCERPTIRDHWDFVNAIQVGPTNGLESAVPYYAKLREFAKAHPGMNIAVTMSGALEAPEHFEVWTDLRGAERPRAFGSTFVAQLGYVSVTNFEAVQPADTEAELKRRADPWPRRVK